MAKIFSPIWNASHRSRSAHDFNERGKMQVTDIGLRPSDKELMERTLRNMQGFAAWSPTDMARLLVSCRLGWHARGNVLSAKVPADAPEIFVIATGHAVHTEVASDRARSNWVLRGPGHILGFSYMLHLPGRVLEYVANDAVVAIHIPGHLLFELLDSNPVYWKDMGRMLLQQERAQIDIAVGQIVGAFGRRLASTIEQLAAVHGARAAETGVVHLRLTQQDLAGLLRASRQSVSKALSAWAASGVIELQYNAIAILDPTALKKIARPLVPQDDGAAA